MTGPLHLKCHRCGTCFEEPVGVVQRISRFLISLMTLTCPVCGTGAQGLGFDDTAETPRG